MDTFDNPNMNTAVEACIKRSLMFREPLPEVVNVIQANLAVKLNEKELVQVLDWLTNQWRPTEEELVSAYVPPKTLEEEFEEMEERLGAEAKPSLEGLIAEILDIKNRLAELEKLLAHSDNSMLLK